MGWRVAPSPHSLPLFLPAPSPHDRAPYPQPGRRRPGPRRVRCGDGRVGKRRWSVFEKKTDAAAPVSPPSSQLRRDGGPVALLPVPRRLVLWARVPKGEEGRGKKRPAAGGALARARLPRPPPSSVILALPPGRLPRQRLCGRGGAGRAGVCGLAAAARAAGEAGGGGGGGARAARARKGRLHAAHPSHSLPRPPCATMKSTGWSARPRRRAGRRRGRP